MDDALGNPAELAEDENERLAEATRPAAMPVAQRMHNGNGQWIDVAFEKRLSYVDRKWYTLDEFIEYYGHSQLSL